MKLDHINISAPLNLLAEVKEFYCNVLKLVEGNRPAFSRHGYWLYSEEQAMLHLIESDGHYPQNKPGYLDHVAFSHTGLDTFINSLNTFDITYQTSYIESLETTQVFLHDPAGIKLEFSFYKEQVT